MLTSVCLTGVKPSVFGFTLLETDKTTKKRLSNFLSCLAKLGLLDENWKLIGLSWTELDYLD